MGAGYSRSPVARTFGMGMGAGGCTIGTPTRLGLDLTSRDKMIAVKDKTAAKKNDKVRRTITLKRHEKNGKKNDNIS
jgi:hypothetical protein